MLDINIIRENPDLVREKLSLKQFGVGKVDELLKIDGEWRKKVAERDELKAEQGRAAADKNIEEAKRIKTKVQELEAEIGSLDSERVKILGELPNMPDDGAPVGRGEEDNVVVREEGEKPEFDFKPKDHLELGVSLGLIDVEQAGQVAGARFSYLLGDLVLMEMALIELAMKEAVAEGFTPVLPPVLVKSEVMRKMGKGKFLDEDDAFYLEKDDLYLIGSAEHTMGALLMDKVVEEAELPKRYIGFSTSFRREAGSYGKDTKGILRRHQFDKVEMFSFAHPDRSKEEHQFLLSMQERLMQKLKLPYQVMDVSTGDMTWGDTRQFDINTWMPGQEAYRETHSCSNTGDYQARGINTRFRDKDGKMRFAHTLNGTAFSQRPLIAILENYQNEDGSVRVPEVLQAYVGKKVIEKK